MDRRTPKKQKRFPTSSSLVENVSIDSLPAIASFLDLKSHSSFASASKATAKAAVRRDAWTNKSVPDSATKNDNFFDSVPPSYRLEQFRVVRQSDKARLDQLLVKGVRIDTVNCRSGLITADTFRNMTDTRRLMLMNYDEFDNNLMRAVFSIKSLDTLLLNICQGYDAEGLRFVPNNLRNLAITFNEDLGADEIEAICANPAIETLRLIQCRGVKTEGLAFLQNLPNLRELDLSQCNNVNSEGLRNIARCKSIRTLRLGRCYNVREDGIEYLAEMPQLRALVLDNYSGTFTTTAKALSKSKSLKDLYVSPEKVNYVKRLTELRVASAETIQDTETYFANA